MDVCPNSIKSKNYSADPKTKTSSQAPSTDLTAPIEKYELWEIRSPIQSHA